MFINSEYPGRIAAGELQRYVTYDRPLPGGGSSRIIAYTEPGDFVKLVVVHQRRHATGAETESDPKMLRLGGVVYWTR